MFSPAHNYIDPFEIPDPTFDEEGNIVYPHYPESLLEELPF